MASLGRMRIGRAGIAGSAAFRLALVAGLLSAGKVLLYTTGTALFLGRDGIAGLPLLYVSLAALATLASLVLGHVVDRVPGGRLLPFLTLAIGLVMAGLLPGVALDLAWAPLALLLTAHLYDIVTDIVFWVLAAAFFDNLRLRRLTTRFYIAIAVGGSSAGILAERALLRLSPTELLPAVMLLMALAVLVLWPMAVPRAAADAGDGPDKVAGLGHLWRLLARHPFALLLALNSMMLTVVYSLTEFVCFALYAEAFTDEAELGRFLALIFAALQLAELAVLWLGARGVVERAGPLLRNLLFPFASLACLLALLAQPRLAFAIIAHINTEAVSNGVFEPVNTTNYGALPAAVHGRARTLADGIFYPLGMALAGLVLAMLPEDDAAFRARVLAVVATGLFVLLNLVVARRYLPTLVRHLRHGQRRTILPSQGPRAGWTASPVDPIRLAPLLGSRRRADRLLAIELVEAALAGSTDPAAGRALVAALAGPLVEAAGRLDDLEEARVAAILASAEPAILDRALEAATAAGERETMALLATARLLAGAAPDASPTGDLAAALADLLADADAEADGTAGDVRHRPARQDDAALGRRLAALVRRAPPVLAPRLARRLGRRDTTEPLRQALLEAVLRHPPEKADQALVALAQQELEAPVAERRALALAALTRMLPPSVLFDLALNALADPGRIVRRIAIEALRPQADLVLARLARAAESRRAEACAAACPPGVIELLAALPGRPARRLLERLIGGLAELAERQALLLDRMALIGDRSLAPLHAALLDHAESLADRLFAGLEALGEAGHAAELRRALGEADARLVAGGIDGLVSLRHGRLARRLVPLLERLHLQPQAAAVARRPRPGAASAETIERSVESLDGRWLRAARRLVQDRRRASGLPVRSVPPSGTDEVVMPIFQRPGPMTDDGTMLEAMLRLKRFELLAALSLDALATLAPLVEERHFAPGLTVQRGGGALPVVWLVDEGHVEVAWPDGRSETAGPGEIVGEAALVDPTVPAPGITARTACRLLLLHRITFEDIARDHPDLTLALCRLLARRLRQRGNGDTNRI